MDENRRADVLEVNKWINGLGIVLICTGTVSILLGLLGGVFTLFAGSMLAPIAMLPVGKSVNVLMDINRAQGGLMVAFGVLSIAALVAGIGLWGKKSWGRAWGLGWSVAALLYLVSERVLNFVYIKPKTEAALLQMMRLGGGNSIVQQTTKSMRLNETDGFSIITLAVLAVLPLLILGMLLKDKYSS